MKLIEVEKALEKLCEYCICGSYEHCKNRCAEYRNISNIPVIEAEPVRHGQVITFTDRWHTMHQTCSECGEELGWKEYPNYCPNCGARMNFEE